MLDSALAQFMQRLLHRDKDRAPVGASSMRLVNDFALGRARGQTVYFTDRDRDEMRSMLATNGYSIEPVAAAGLSRSDRLSGGIPNEKSGGGTVKKGRVSLKSLYGHPLLLGGKPLDLPAGTHLDADWSAFSSSLEHTSIMVVENYELFDQVHRVAFALPARFASPLVIYRGDRHESRMDNVQAFVQSTGLPVLACVDIDPQGLMIAASFDNLIGVIAPSPSVLDGLLASPATGRRDLFQTQYLGVASSLDLLSAVHCLRPLWTMMQTHRAGVVQERWIGSGLKCVLWSEDADCHRGTPTVHGNPKDESA